MNAPYGYYDTHLIGQGTYVPIVESPIDDDYYVDEAEIQAFLASLPQEEPEIDGWTQFLIDQESPNQNV